MSSAIMSLIKYMYNRTNQGKNQLSASNESVRVQKQKRSSFFFLSIKSYDKYIRRKKNCLFVRQKTVN